MKKILLGGIIGGVIVFIWGMISWTILPWHMDTLSKFKSEMIVQKILETNALEKGVYILPNADGASKEKQKKAHEQMVEGPFAFVVMSPNGTSPMPISMLCGLLTQISAGLLMMWLLLQTSIKGYFKRVAFVKVVAFCAGILCLIPEWNWWGFPLPYILVGMLDLVIGWSLAGLWMARVAAQDA